MAPKKQFPPLAIRATLLALLTLGVLNFSRRTSNVYSSDSHNQEDSIFNADQKNAYGASINKIEKQLEEGTISRPFPSWLSFLFSLWFYDIFKYLFNQLSSKSLKYISGFRPLFDPIPHKPNPKILTKYTTFPSNINQTSPQMTLHITNIQTQKPPKKNSRNSNSQTEANSTQPEKSSTISSERTNHKSQEETSTVCLSNTTWAKQTPASKKSK